MTSMEGRQIKESDLEGSLDGTSEANPQDRGYESESLANLRENDNQLYEALTLLRGVNLLAPRDLGVSPASEQTPESVASE